MRKVLELGEKMFYHILGDVPIGGDPGPGVVFDRPEMDTAATVVDLYGNIEVGHRLTVHSGRDTPNGRVTPGSNHTHIQCALKNAPEGRRAWQIATVDTLGATWVIETYEPVHIFDPSHQFFTPNQSFSSVRKAENAEGVRSMATGPAVSHVDGVHRVGWGDTFTEYDSVAREVRTVVGGFVVQTLKVPPPPVVVNDPANSPIAVDGRERARPGIDVGQVPLPPPDHEREPPSLMRRLFPRMKPRA
jgi:hypothetical protein